MYNTSQNFGIDFWGSGSLSITKLLATVIDKKLTMTEASFLTSWSTGWCNSPVAYSCSTQPDSDSCYPNYFYFFFKRGNVHSANQSFKGSALVLLTRVFPWRWWGWHLAWKRVFWFTPKISWKLWDDLVGSLLSIGFSSILTDLAPWVHQSSISWVSDKGCQLVLALGLMVFSMALSQISRSLLQSFI